MIEDVLLGKAMWHIECADVLDGLALIPSESVQVCVTSPPYWALRSYLPEGHESKHLELGSEPTPSEYIANMVAVFEQVKRVLRSDGTCWVNIGDSYAGGNYRGGGVENANAKWVSNRGMAQNMGTKAPPIPPGLKPKDLCLIPQRLAIALQDSGWWVRSWITWCKRAPMPESVTDRPTSATEVILLLAKSATYYYDADAVRERDALVGYSSAGFRSPRYMNNNAFDNSRIPDTKKGGGPFSRAYAEAQPGHGAMQLERPVSDGTRNMWNYWLLGPEPQSIHHYACYPSEIPRRAIKAGSRPGDVVLDPFAGSGTTLSVAVQLGRRALGIELNADYVKLAERRMEREAAGYTLPMDLEAAV